MTCKQRTKSKQGLRENDANYLIFNNEQEIANANVVRGHSFPTEDVILARAQSMKKIYQVFFSPIFLLLLAKTR